MPANTTSRPPAAHHATTRPLALLCTAAATSHLPPTPQSPLQPPILLLHPLHSQPPTCRSSSIMVAHCHWLEMKGWALSNARQAASQAFRSCEGR